MARPAVPGGEKTAALVVASAPLAVRRRYALAACPPLVLAVLPARYNAKPIAVATVVLAGYPAVVYRRFPGEPR